MLQILNNFLNKLIKELKTKRLYRNNKSPVKEKNLSSNEVSGVDGNLLLLEKKAKSLFFSRRPRIFSLCQASLYVLQTKGTLALIRQFYKFIRGERNNVVIPIPTLSQKTEAELYKQWIKKNSINKKAIKKQKSDEKNLHYRPLISIITPVFNTDKKILEKMVKSVIAQTYSNWELCLVDGASTNSHVQDVLDKFSHQDNRIKVRYLNKNLGIAENSNQAIQMAEGEFIALLDHDDELTADALYENVLLLNQFPNADIIYSDEDKLDLEGVRCDPHFKPDWSPDLFYSMMYTCHFGVYRKSLVVKIGGFRDNFEGAQDYDLVLRLIEQTSEIYHIPKVLYHWRKTESSTSMRLDNKNYAKDSQIRAVSEHFQRLNISAEVSSGLADNLLRVKRSLLSHPKVSIIVPTKDQVDLLKNCIDSIEKRTGYKNYEIIVVNNKSEKTETLKYLNQILNKPNITVLEYDYPFNFASINNFAVKHAAGEILLFLNNDTEVISEEWLESMVEHIVRPEVGVVGARLLYSNGIIQHAGVIIGIGGVAGHSHKYLPQNHPGYFSRAKAIQNLSAVTGACMMVKKKLFESLGGFNEKDLPVAFNDIDFCLRVRQKQLLIIYTPYAEVYHHESVSRGQDETPEKALRFQREVEYMLNHWGKALQKDPYYNVNLTLIKEDFSIMDVGSYE